MQGAVIHKAILCYDTFIVAPAIPCRTHSVSTYTDIVQIIRKEPDMEGMNTCFEHQHQTAVKNVDSLPLAMAYVPWQSWKNIYKAEDALMEGTIFKELNLPFTGRRCMK